MSKYTKTKKSHRSEKKAGKPKKKAGEGKSSKGRKPPKAGKPAGVKKARVKQVKKKLPAGKPQKPAAVKKKKPAVKVKPAKPSKGRCLLVHDGTAIMASGLFALAEFLKKNGFDCEIRNCFSERRFGLDAGFESDIKKFDVLGISIHWFYQIPASIELARKAREISRRPFIVAAGFTASAFAEEIVAQSREIDAVIKGDGEIPLLKLCSEIASGKKNLDSVPNLYYSGRGGKVLRSGAGDYAADKNILDKLDFGDLSSLRNWHYYVHTSSWREITDGAPDIGFDIDTTFYLCGGRGCSVQCVFCGGGIDAHRIHSMRKKSFIFRSPKRIADDVEAALKHGYRSFHACFDPTPNGKHWFEFMSDIRKRLIHTNFIFESFSLPSDKFIRTAKQTFDHGILVISPESAVETIRKKCKGFYYTNRQLENCLETIGITGLNAHIFFGYFLPGDNEKSVENTMAYIDSLVKSYGEFINVFYYPYSTDPCSPLALAPDKFKMSGMVSTFENYRSELSKEENLRGNLLRHFPVTKEKSQWDMLSLRIELERAAGRRIPLIADEIRSKLKTKTGEFYKDLARKLAEEEEIGSIQRNALHDYVMSYYTRSGI